MKVLLVIDEPICLESAPASRNYHIGRVLNRLGIETIVLPNNKGILNFIKGKSRIKKYLRRVYLFFYMLFIIPKRKINYIFARGEYICLEAVILTKFYRIKTIFDFHGYVHEEEIHRGQRYKAVLTRLLENICLKNSNIVVTQTKNNIDVVKKLNKNVFVLENGVDLEEFDRFSSLGNLLEKYLIPVNKPIVGFIGNWENWMKIEDLLFASRFLDGTSVIVIGEGSNFTKYKNEFKKVVFTGTIPHEHTISLLMNFDICVSPHSKDKMMQFRSARKTLEYMAAGKPIIVSNVVGREKFLKEEVNCLLYESENPEDLVEKINILLSDRKLINRIGINNKKLSNKFTWEKSVYESGILRALNKRK